HAERLELVRRGTQGKTGFVRGLGGATSQIGGAGLENAGRFRLLVRRDEIRRFKPAASFLAQCSHVRLGNRLTMDLVINAAEEFRGIGETLRCCLLNEAGSESNTVGRGFDESVELGARELALLVGAEKKRCAVSHYGMAFALTAALRRGAVEFLHALVECVDLNSGQKITARAGGPGALVQPTKNEMRPRLILGLRGREKLDAGVGMLAEQIARDAHADRKLIEPLQKERPRKDRVDL